MRKKPTDAVVLLRGPFEADPEMVARYTKLLWPEEEATTPRSPRTKRRTKGSAKLKLERTEGARRPKKTTAVVKS